MNRGSKIKDAKWKAKHWFARWKIEKNGSVYGARYRIRMGKANKIEDYVCGQRAGWKLERGMRRVEEM